MGSIAVIEATVSSQVSTDTGDSDFVNVVVSDTLVEGTVYHVICSASVESGDATALFEWRLYDQTNDEELLDSKTVREQTQSGQPQSYNYMGRFTVGSEGGGLAFQQKGYPTPDYRPARTNFLSMLLLDMSDIDESDFFFETTGAVSDQNTFTYGDRVTHTETGVEEDDEWLVFGWIAHWVNSVARNTMSKMTCDDAGDEEPELSFEGEDLSEEIQWWMCRSYTMTGDNSSVEWKMEARVDQSGTNSYTKNSSLFGIKLSSFADSSQTYSAGAATPPDSDFYQMARANFTPTQTGKVIVAACSTYVPDGTARKAGQRIQKDGTTIPNTQPDYENFLNSNDATDELPLSYITVFDGAADTEAVIDYDVRSSYHASAVEFEDTTLAIFGTSTALAPITFSAVAKQVYTSGDVAAETFDAGSKASQTLASGDVAGQGFASGDTAAQSHSGGDVEAEARP